MNSIILLQKELRSLGSKEKAENSAWFFKTGKGEYGYGDVFIGVNVPDQRKIAKKYLDLNLKDTENLIKSPIHEFRLTALLTLVEKYKRGNEKEKEQIFKFYLKNTKQINNWDLVDLSAPHIVGKYLLERDKNILYKLAKSKNLWEKRISMVATYEFIRNNNFQDTINIGEILLDDTHDLIHKAVGWMLREVGKKSQKTEEKFLNKHANKMPRTMLRYAIERFEEKKRQFYLKSGKK